MRPTTLKQLERFRDRFASGGVYDMGGANAVYRAEQGYDLSELLRRTVKTVDIADGPGVDVVDDLEELRAFADASVDNAICSDALEHVRRPHRVCEALARVIRPGGVLYLATVFVYPVHGHVVDGDVLDYFRFTPLALRFLCEPHFDVVECGFQAPARGERGVYLLGERRACT